MISEVLSAIDELYIQEASCELNSCLEILNEYDKLYKTQGIVSINTYDMNKFFQENAWSDEVKRMNRGKSTINKIIFTIPRMIVALVKLITGQLKKHKPVTQQQAQRIEQQIQHVNPKNIHVSKKGSMLDIVAVVGGSAALAGAGAIAYIGFKKAASPKTKLDKQDLDKARMMLVLEQKKTADQAEQIKQLEKEKEKSDELAEINKNYATEKEEGEEKANKALTAANKEIERLKKLNKDSEKENKNLTDKNQQLENDNTLLRAEMSKFVSPEECSKRLSGIYIEFIKLLSDMVSVVKENPNKERIDGIKKQIQEITKEFNIDTRGKDETVVVSFEELCKYVNENAKKVEELSGKLKTLKTEFDLLTKNNNDQIDANVKLAKQNEELRKKLEDRKKENKKKFKENVDAAIKFIPNNSKFNKLKDELKALEKKIEESRETHSGLLGEIKEAESKKNKLNEEVNAAQKSHDAEMDKLKNTFNEEKSNHDAEMNKLKNEQQEANKILSDITAEIEKLKNEKKDLENKIKTATDIDNLNEKANRLDSELQNKKAEIAGKDEKISKLEKELKEKDKELNALKTAHSTFDKSFSNYAYLDKKISDEYFKQTKIKQTDEKTASTAENEDNEELLAICADAMKTCTQSLTSDVKHISDAQELISEVSEIAVTSEKPEESEESEQQQEKPEEPDKQETQNSGEGSTYKDGDKEYEIVKLPKRKPEKDEGYRIGTWDSTNNEITNVVKLDDFEWIDNLYMSDGTIQGSFSGEGKDSVENCKNNGFIILKPKNEVESNEADNMKSNIDDEKESEKHEEKPETTEDSSSEQPEESEEVNIDEEIDKLLSEIKDSDEEKPEENDEKSEESENSETEDVDDSSKELEESEETNDNPTEPEEDTSEKTAESDVGPSEQQQEQPEESEKHEEKPETTEDVAMKHAIEKAIEDKHTQPISLKQAQQDMRSALQGNGTAGFMTDDPDRPGKLKKVDNFNEAKYIVLNDYFLYPKQFGNIKNADLDPKIFNIDFKDITNNNTTIEPALISSMSRGDIILKGNIYNTNPDQYNAIRDERNKPKETQSLDTSINNFDYDKELDELEKFNPNKDQQLTDNNDDIQNTSDNRDDNDKTTEETSGEQKTFVFDDHAIYGNKSDDNGYRIFNEISDIGDDTLRQLIADGVDTLYKCFIKNESKYEFVSIFGNSNFLKEHFKDKYIKNFLTTTYVGTSKEFMDKLKELNITVAKFKKFEDNTNIDELRKKYPNLIVVNSEYTFPRKKTIGERVNDSFGKWFKSGDKNDLRDADDTTNSTNEKMQQYIDKSNEVMNQVDDVTAKAMNLKQ